MNFNAETISALFVLITGGLFVLKPDVGAYLLRKAPLRYGHVFHKVPEEKKVARSLFVRLMGTALILGGFLMLFEL